MITGAMIIGCAAVFWIAGTVERLLYSDSFPSTITSIVLVALCAAIALHMRFMILARREQRETSCVLDQTGREFQSIFDGALDAILILDDTGKCLEANPAALRLLGADRGGVVGQSIQKFLPRHTGPEESWKHFLRCVEHRGDVDVVRSDGATVSVEYTAQRNYLPGRHVAILRDVTLRNSLNTALRASDERFQQMANNIREIYWMIDARTKHVLYVNPAYETITGRSLATLRENPTSYQEILHPEDRVRVLTRLEDAVQTGEFDEEFRIVRPNHSIRWISARGFPVQDSSGAIHRLVGIAQDVSARKSAEEQMAKNLISAEAARAEADAFRKATLALTQNLKMNCVLDSLLESLLQLVPCESARILLVESDAYLFLARELQNSTTKSLGPGFPNTLDAKGNRFLARVLATQNSLLIPDTAVESDWSNFAGSAHMRSWLCVPLVASQHVLGVLSLGDTRARFFTAEHLRLAKSLAIPAAVAIQNARLYERAEIYSIELEQRLADLKNTERALAEAEASRTSSEDKFAKVFQASPMAFSIATVSDGRFLDVNQAFERRYHYSRQELLGRTDFEIGIWENRADRLDMLDEIRKRGQLRNRLARFRTRSGDLLETIYSADIIEIGGQQCLLVVSQDVPARTNLTTPQTSKAASIR